MHEGWPAHTLLQPRDIIISIDGAQCPASHSKLRALLCGAVGSTVEFNVQSAGSSTVEGVRSIKIVRRQPRLNKKAEVSTGRGCSRHAQARVRAWSRDCPCRLQLRCLQSCCRTRRRHMMRRWRLL